MPAVVSSGIWPGVSALMLAEAVDRLKAEGGKDTQIDSAHMSFYTAGTGTCGTGYGPRFRRRIHTSTRGMDLQHTHSYSKAPRCYGSETY